MKDSSESQLFTTRRVALIEGDSEAAEMLHTFFRLMDLEPTLLDPSQPPVPTVRRLAPDILILDLDLPDLRALEIARQLRAALPDLPLLFTTSGTLARRVGGPVVAKPRRRFEELLRLFEAVLALER